MCVCVCVWRSVPLRVITEPLVVCIIFPLLLCPWRGFYDDHKSRSQSYQDAVFKPAAPLVYNSTPVFSPRKYTRSGAAYGLHPRKSPPPSSASDGSVSWWIIQTRWPPKSCHRVNMVFVIAPVKGFVGRGGEGGRIRVLKGGPWLERLIICMLMEHQHHFSQRLNLRVYMFVR